MPQQWADRGLMTHDEMQTNCCYAKQDKTWVHNPDGNEWEVFVVLEDNLPVSDPLPCDGCSANGQHWSRIDQHVARNTVRKKAWTDNRPGQVC